MRKEAARWARREVIVQQKQTHQQQPRRTKVTGSGLSNLLERERLLDMLDGADGAQRVPLTAAIIEVERRMLGLS